jgi:hypothetical protein
MSALSSRRIEGADDIGELFTEMCRRGYSDGLPVIPPTEERVRAMLDYTGMAPGEVIAVVPPSGGPATAEKVAINAVMAGCLPEYMPVIAAALRALAEPEFNWLGIQTTTNPVGPMLVINGPIRAQIGVACGRGCMGPGFRANATIGRAIRLIMLNVGACPPGEVDKAIHGMPGKFTFCFGELEEHSPWEPFHVERGFPRETSAVTVVGGQGTSNIYAAYLQPESICRIVADGIACYGYNGYLRGTGNPVVVLPPGHARIFAEHGWDKKRIKERLFELAHIPLSRLPEETPISSATYADWDRSRSIPPCAKADDIVILVAGGPEAYHVTYVPSFSSTTMVTKPIAVPKEQDRRPRNQREEAVNRNS